MEVQTKKVLRGRGGPGRGQGRKKTMHGRVPHRAREQLDGRSVVHVTTRIDKSLPSLRARALWPTVLNAFVQGCAVAADFRIVHFTVDRAHLHLICEADDRAAITEAMKGFKNRLTRAINKVLGRKGTVFVGRFHERVLRTPAEVRHALAYVLADHDDPFSSAAYFDGWTDTPKPRSEAMAADDGPVAAPRTRLLKMGWRKAGGPIAPGHVPDLPKHAPPLPVL